MSAPQIPRFVHERFEVHTQYEVIETKEWIEDGRIEIYLQHKEQAHAFCHRCHELLVGERGKHRLRLEGMPVMGLRLFVHLWRRKGYCENCKKVRSERIRFVSDESPHLMDDYAWWLGRLCEIAAVSRVAELLNQDETTVWRIDFRRLQSMLEHYRIPQVRRISVDEVYARRKPKYEGEPRDDRFFTVITDLDTRRVIWVTFGRSSASLSSFFEAIGKRACGKIEVVACDMHEDYAYAVKEHCPRATLVWDRFHVMQSFEKALNEDRKELHEGLRKGTNLWKATRGRYRFIFLKKASRRTEEESRHINDVIRDNDSFVKLEFIKERMLTYFDSRDIGEARGVWSEVGSWIHETGVKHLHRWWWNLESRYEQLTNYFRFRVTSALSEGVNNVIKTLKRRAYGYRNMEYFRLKIMQTCGYLNSRFIHSMKSITYT